MEGGGWELYEIERRIGADERRRGGQGEEEKVVPVPKGRVQV